MRVWNSKRVTSSAEMKYSIGLPAVSYDTRSTSKISPPAQRPPALRLQYAPHSVREAAGADDGGVRPGGFDPGLRRRRAPASSGHRDVEHAARKRFAGRTQ